MTKMYFFQIYMGARNFDSWTETRKSLIDQYEGYGPAKIEEDDYGCEEGSGDPCDEQE